MTTLVALVPAGPLHPDDALWALGVGLGLGVVLRRSPGLWVSSLVASALILFELRYPGAVLDGFVQRPSPVWPVLVVLALGTAGSLMTSRAHITLRSAVGLSVAALTVVWTIVPDTEAALVFGGVMLGALMRTPSVPAGRAGGLLFAIPVIAAVIGTVGRPSELRPALLALAVFGVAGAVLIRLGHRQRTGRAGLPTTVVPAATSSTTTAPAPTTAP